MLPPETSSLTTRHSKIPRKLRKDLYDTPDNPFSAIVPGHYQGVEQTVDAALEIMVAIGCEIKSRDELKVCFFMLMGRLSLLRWLKSRRMLADSWRVGEVTDAPEFEIDEEDASQLVASRSKEWPSFSLNG
jgi:hypothetical protein